MKTQTKSHDIQPQPLLTTKRLVAIFFIQLNETYQMSVLLPIVVFMCRDFGISSKWLGVYSSLLNASFSFCQFSVCYLWGVLSDKYGRRNILIIGLLGTSIAMLVFGFSTSFQMALIARSFTGLFNGNLAVLRSYLADITDSTNRGYAFTITGVSYGFGGILGSMLGGILINTSDVDVSDDEYIKTQSILKWSIFNDFPYVLPITVCGGIVSVNALIWALLYIQDVNTIKRAIRASTFDDTVDIVSDIEMTSNLTAPTFFTLKPAEVRSTHKQSYQYSLEHLPVHQSLPSHHEINEMLSTFEADKMQLLSETQDTHELNTVKDLLKHTKYPHTLFQYGVIALAWYMFKEMGPVFMAQGLSFNSAYIGYTQAFAGVIYFIFATVIQPTLLKKVQHNKLMLICISITVITHIMMPSTYWFTFIDDQNSNYNFMTDEIWLLCMVCVVEFLFTVSMSVVWTVATCWVNNAVPIATIAKANGVAMTVSALLKACGPMITGFIWSDTVTQLEDNSHFAVYFAYLPGAIMFLFAIADLIAYIPPHLQLTFEEQTQRKMAIKAT